MGTVGRRTRILILAMRTTIELKGGGGRGGGREGGGEGRREGEGRGMG
jgi:hypothetical protein